jgi:hemolysin activation/secretion protein
MRRGIAVPRAARPVLLALVALAASVAGAQQPTAPATADPKMPPTPPMAKPAAPAVFPIRGFRVEGENPIGDAAAQRVLAPFIRPDATLETLQQATAALEKALRDKGYGLHRVALPPQEVGQNVTLNIVKFAIGKVDIEGRKIYDEGNIRRTVPELREGESPNFKRLAVQTAIANENPNKQVQVGLRESEEPDKIDATITVREQRPWTWGVSASNYGTKETGEDRVTLTAGHTNLFNRDHQFIGAYTTSLQRPEDVKQLGLAYKIPLYALGGVVGASYTHSTVVGNFGAFSSTGAGHTFGVNYTMYLPPQGGRRSYASLGLDNKLFEGSRINGIRQPNALDRRTMPLTLGFTARTESDTSVWGYNTELAVNTGAGSSDDLTSFQSEDPRITTVHWKAIRGGASYVAPFAKNWLWSARGLFQYSPDILVAGEQFGLGGVSSIRGTIVERPISADSGISGTLEVSTPELMTGLRLLGFVDAGYLWNHSPVPSKPGTDRLASVGLGLRYGVGAVAVSMDYGRVITGSRTPVAVNQFAPQSGDDRFYINVSVRF